MCRHNRHIKRNGKALKIDTIFQQFNEPYKKTTDKKEHEIFVRRELHIHMDLPLNFAQAALGSEVLIPTLEGEEPIQVPGGVQTGQTYRLKGKGIPELRGRRRGDQIVRFWFMTPDKISEEQKNLLAQLGETLPDYTQDTPPEKKGLFSRFKDALGN